MVSDLSERSHADYSPEDLALVLDACRNVANALGDMVTHAIVIGGLVPSLLIETPATGATHVGTVDLDLGLQLGLTEDDFRRMATLLDDAGPAQDLARRRDLSTQPAVDHPAAPRGVPNWYRERPDGALQFDGTRPGPDWHAHGYLPRP